MESNNQEWYQLYTELVTHRDISRLGKTKIVSTPHSGQQPKKFLNMWINLNEENKNYLTHTIYKRENKWTLGVFVYHDKDNKIPEGRFMGNIIIFYVVEYLELLAKVCKKTSQELLNIFAIVQEESYNKDLIKIAFGDIFGNGYDENPLATEEGSKVLDTYLNLL
jgi:hypothetical protein